MAAKKPGKKPGKKLTVKQRLFVQAYIINFNATEAAIVAGYDPKYAYIQGWQNLEKPHIEAAVEVAIEQRMKRLRVKADNILYRLMQAVNLDYTEFDQTRVVPCDFCYGEDDAPEPEEGAEDNIPPVNADCKKCYGKGVNQVYITDTTKLSANARAVYQGSKQGKYGIEVVKMNKADAIAQVGRHLGLNKDTLDVTTNGNDIPSGLGHFYGRTAADEGPENDE